jgi:hypothetical protein
MTIGGNLMSREYCETQEYHNALANEIYAVIKDCDAQAAYYLSCRHNLSDSQISFLAGVIIKAGDPYYALNFAKLYPNRIDIQRFQDIVLSENYPIYHHYHRASYVYSFAKYVPGADINACQNVIVKCSEKKWIRQFLHNIPGANITKLNAILMMMD